jgi:hypothetical protein
MKAFVRKSRVERSANLAVYLLHMAETTGIASHLLGSDATNIYSLVDKAKSVNPFAEIHVRSYHSVPSVHGLNLTVPEHARDVIKVSHQRRIH